MSLRQSYRRMKWFTKLGVWGAIASIIALIAIPLSCNEPKVSHITTGPQSPIIISQTTTGLRSPIINASNVIWNEYHNAYASPPEGLPKAHLRFGLRPRNPTFPEIELTNSVFFLRNRNYKATDIRGNVVIPIAPTNSESFLDFVLINDSQVSSISGFRLWLWIVKKWKCSLSNRWQYRQQSTDPELDCWFLESDHWFSPEEHLTIESMKHIPADVVGSSVALGLTLSTKGATNNLISFWLSFVDSAQVASVCVLTNSQASGSNVQFAVPLDALTKTN